MYENLNTRELYDQIGPRIIANSSLVNCVYGSKLCQHLDKKSKYKKCRTQRTI